MGNIGDKLTTLPIVIGELIPLAGDFTCQLNKGITQDRDFIAGLRVRLLHCQLFDRAHTVLFNPADIRRQLFYWARYPIPNQHPGQQTKHGHQ